MRIPIPWTDVVESAVNTTQGLRVGKVWTICWEGITPLWVRMDPSQAHNHRNLLIEQYCKQRSMKPLTNDEEDELAICMASSREADYLQAQQDAATRLIDRQQKEKFDNEMQDKALLEEKMLNSIAELPTLASMSDMPKLNVNKERIATNKTVARREKVRNLQPPEFAVRI